MSRGKEEERLIAAVIWLGSLVPLINGEAHGPGAFDRIIQAGGYITVSTGSAPEANLTPVPKPLADRAFEAAECIGCGACVAQCPNGAANLFTGAKVSHLNMLPQGQAERESRAVGMVEQMEQEGFGACSNFAECEAVCPKGIPIDFIARMNRDYLKSKAKGVTRVGA